MRGVKESDLIAQASQSAPLSKKAPAAGKILGGEDLGAMFGLDMASGPVPPAKKDGVKKAVSKKKVVKKAVAKKTAAKKSASKKAKAPSSPWQK